MAVLAPTGYPTLADVIEHLGVPSRRIRTHPEPGTATEQDVLDLDAHHDILVELIDGVLVEKGMGFYESALAAALIESIRAFVRTNDLGVVTGEAGMVRLDSGVVRMPDVSFTSWERLPDGDLPEDPIPDVAPDLAVEVLSASNTPAEMERKLAEYFASGVRRVWLIDRRSRTLRDHSSPSQYQVLQQDQYVEGGDVLPGFRLLLRDLFEAGTRKKRS